MLLFLVWIIVSSNYWRYILFTIKVLFSTVWYCSMRIKLIFFLRGRWKSPKSDYSPVKICKIYSFKISCYMPESVEYFVEDLAFSPSYQLAPSPPPPPYQPVVSFSQSSCVSQAELTKRKGRGEGWGGAKSYDGGKAWSSINHSILSALGGQL